MKKAIVFQKTNVQKSVGFHYFLETLKIKIFCLKGVPILPIHFTLNVKHFGPMYLEIHWTFFT